MSSFGISGRTRSRAGPKARPAAFRHRNSWNRNSCAGRAFDGSEITGFLYLPDTKKFPGPRPVIVNIHGGPEAQFRPGFLGRKNYLINELGCATLFPNVRGSSGYGKTFVKLDNGFKREDSYKDISALLDWIKTSRATRRQPNHGNGRLLWRVYDAGRGIPIMPIAFVARSMSSASRISPPS